MVLKCYDWATAKHEGCVVSGFSSKLEQDVLHFLIKAKCPRSPGRFPDPLIYNGRLLILKKPAIAF
jgi:hypothetical protein